MHSAAREDRDAVAFGDADRADLRAAYERGRKDERASRRRHPVFMTFTFIAAIIGVALMALAAVNGSFAGAGAVVDHNLAIAANQAGPAVGGAASGAGEAVRNAVQRG